jgi:N-dimethylarginine dimethylaminohydrolase
MHRPGEELALVTSATTRNFGFSSPVDIPVFLEEFDALAAALSALGAEVVLLTDVLKRDPEALAYIAKRPNMTYTRDLAVVFDRGVLLMSMFHKGRKGDTWVIRRAMERLGIPVIGEIQPPGFVEGGGVMFLSERQVIVSLCDRTTESAIFQMCDLLLDEHVDELIMAPVAEGEVHIDGLLMFVSPHLALAYRPHIGMYPATIFRKGRPAAYVWLPDYLEAHGFEIFEVSEEEKNRACINYVTVAPLTVVGYDWASRTHEEIHRRGGRAVGIPGTQLLRGNAGPHCMTCPLLKD